MPIVCDKCNSAKQRGTDDTTPQSNYARIQHDGSCIWVPSFLWSVSHCPMDTTWFPFDEHSCHLAYESWRYTAHKVNLTSDLRADGEYYGPWVDDDFEPNDQWEFLGNYFLE